jgi:glycosyltransferase involved in cell wall biosynthesis
VKILFLNGKYPFCYYYRGYLPAIYSNQECIGEFLHLLDETPKDIVSKKIYNADVVVMQRPNTQEALNLAKLLKGIGKKVIFENDDTYLYGKGIDPNLLENDEQRKKAKEISTITNEILKIADGAIASTPILADEYRQVNSNVCVLKNCIDPLDELPCKKNTTGKFRIGFIGSVTSNEDYVHIKEQIKQLDDRGDITIVVFGIKHKDGSTLSFMKKDRMFWESLKNVEWQHYVPVLKYFTTLASLALDVIIIPRNDSYFNRCKSNLKFLEASLLKIPVIAQGFDGSPYEQDKDYLTLVYDNNDWYNTIIRIKENYNTYKELAVRAHDYVLENYNIKKYAQEWVEEINKLCSRTNGKS